MYSRAEVLSMRRGATVLIVILVLGMLTAVGMFAARASQLGISNSGRLRQATQTRFLSEMGAYAVLSEFERDPVVYKNRLSSSPAVPPGSGAKMPCMLVPYLDGITTSPSYKPADERCIRIGDDTLTARAGLTIPGVQVVTDRTPGPKPGGLGIGDTEANFGAEVSDLTEVPVPVAGYSVGTTITSDMRLYRVTVLSTGQILPTNAAGTPFALETEESRYLTSLDRTRVHLVVGPVK